MAKSIEQIHRWPIKRLIPYARNARKHSAEQVAQLAASIKEFGWTDAQMRAYAIADNRIPQKAGWDEALLQMELEDLKKLGFDVALTGFEDDDLAKAAGKIQGGGVHEVDVAEVNDRFWISIRGPLKHQAKALKALQKATASIEGVEVELGTIDEF